MKTIEEQIRAYVNTRQKRALFLAMLAAGRAGNHTADEIARNVIAHVLLDFNGIDIVKYGKS